MDVSAIYYLIYFFINVCVVYVRMGTTTMWVISFLLKLKHLPNISCLCLAIILSNSRYVRKHFIFAFFVAVHLLDLFFDILSWNVWRHKTEIQVWNNDMCNEFFAPCCRVDWSSTSRRLECEPPIFFSFLFVWANKRLHGGSYSKWVPVNGPFTLQPYFSQQCHIWKYEKKGKHEELLINKTPATPVSFFSFFSLSAAVLDHKR